MCFVFGRYRPERCLGSLLRSGKKTRNDGRRNMRKACGFDSQ